MLLVCEMGTTGLLTLLTAAAAVVNIFGGLLDDKVVAVDSSVWLHQLCLRYPKEVHEGNFKPVATAFINRARDVAASGAQLIFIFENRKVLAKAQTDRKRAEKRAKAYAELENMETDDVEVDDKVLKALLSVSPELVTAVIREVRIAGYKYEVAPGEADSQLVYHARVKKDVDYVLTDRRL